MADKVIIGNNFNPSLVGRQITSISDSSILTNNVFQIDKEIVVTREDKTAYFGKTTTPKTNVNLNEEFFIDYSNILNYIYYSSARDFLILNINNIFINFPYSVLSDNSLVLNNVLAYNYDEKLNKTYFEIPSTSLVVYDDSVITSNITTEKNNDISKNFDLYEIFIPFSGETYEILKLETPNKVFSGKNIKITVTGKFPNVSIPFHIKPKNSVYNQFLSNLNDFQRYILKDRRDNYYNVRLKNLEGLNDVVELIDKNYKLYFSDGYNLDINNDNFDFFLSQVSNLGTVFDENKTDFLYRCIIPENIKEYDLTENLNLRNLISSLAVHFDLLYKTSKSIKNVYNVRYKEKDSTLKTLIPEISEIMGLEYQRLIPDTSGITLTGNTVVDSEINLVLWNRILTNAPWIISNKATRNVLDFFFRYMGLDDCYYTINEYINIFDSPLNIREDWENVDTRLTEKPYNDDLTPKSLVGTDIYFHTDDYYKIYNKLGYNTTEIVDNEKASVDSNPLIGNNKELEFYIDAFKALECEVWKINSEKIECISNCDDVEFNFTFNEFPNNEITLDSFTFQTNFNSTLRGDFKLAFITENGEDVTITLPDGSEYKTNNLSVSNPSLNGGVQTITVTASNLNIIKAINFSNMDIYGELDFSKLTFNGNVNLANNNRISNITFSSNNNIIPILDLQSCYITTTNLNLQNVLVTDTLNINSCLNIQTVTFKTTTLKNILANNSGITGIFDLTDVTFNGGIFEAKLNSGMTNIVHSSALNKIYSYNIQASTNIATLDLTDVQFTGGDLTTIQTSSLTTILHSTYSNLIRNYNGFLGGLNGTLDLTNVIVTNNINLSNNGNLSAITISPMEISSLNIISCGFIGVLDLSDLVINNGILLSNNNLTDVIHSSNKVVYPSVYWINDNNISTITFNGVNFDRIGKLSKFSPSNPTYMTLANNNLNTADGIAILDGINTNSVVSIQMGDIIYSVGNSIGVTFSTALDDVITELQNKGFNLS